MRYQKIDQNLLSVGWLSEGVLSATDDRFNQLVSLLTDCESFWRFKGVVEIDGRVMNINITSKEIHVSPSESALTSRFECIFSEFKGMSEVLETIENTFQISN